MMVMTHVDVNYLIYNILNVVMNDDDVLYNDDETIDDAFYHYHHLDALSLIVYVYYAFDDGYYDDCVMIDDYFDDVYVYLMNAF